MGEKIVKENIQNEKMTLDRVIKMHGDKGLIAISACLNPKDQSMEEREKATKLLEQDIIKAGYSYKKTWGGYKENTLPEGFEDSFIVFNYSSSGELRDWANLYKFAIEMCKKYHQHSVLIKAPGKNPIYVGQNGEKVNEYETDKVFKNDSSQEYYTSLKSPQDLEISRREKLKSAYKKMCRQKGIACNIEGFKRYLQQHINGEYPAERRFTYDIHFPDIDDEGVNTLQESQSTKKHNLILTEEQLAAIKDCELLEEIQPTTFSIEALNKIPSPTGKVKYCNMTLQRIGAGSARAVFKINENAVIKVARNRKGIAQNETEINYAHVSSLFTQIYKAEENATWIIAEYARRAKSQDFVRLTGHNFKFVCEFIDLCKSQYARYGRWNPSPQWEEFYEGVMDYKVPNWEFFYEINEYLTAFSLEAVGDLKRPSTWGVANRQNGEELVIVDYGLDDEVYSTHYALREDISRGGVQIKFNLDKISQKTLSDDGSEPLTEASNFILRRNNWEINNYERFLQIINETPADKKGFLSQHPLEELQQREWITYTLKGYDVAFALHLIEPGKVDICNLVNNTHVQAERENNPSKVLKGIGQDILTFAKMEGGTQMDNYRGADGSNGFLGNKYRKAGFDRQTWRDEFNPAYQPAEKEWQFDTEKYGFPDVEGLERSKHRMRYNRKNADGETDSAYKQKFDNRMNKKFYGKD